MSPIEIDEVGPGKEFQLDADTVHALQEHGLVKAERLGGGWWLLKARDKVGMARVGDVEVWIRPKLMIDRLLFLMGYYRNPLGWQPEDVSVGEADDLVTVMAYLFERQASRALRHGVLQGYHTVDDTLPVLRGRLRLADQFRRHYGMPIPLEVRYDDFTVDIGENRLLLAAIDSLLDLPRVRVETLRRLRRLRTRLTGVTPVRTPATPPAWRPTRQNVPYRKALQLAELIVRTRSAEVGGSGVPVSGFLLTMHRIFEDFVCVALREQLRGHGGKFAVQKPLHLDEAERHEVRPDLVWWSDTGKALAVVDAKYAVGMDNEHVFQVLSYCSVLGLTRAHLVYAAGADHSETHVLLGSGIEIVEHALDLDTTREDLMDQIRRLADAVRTP